MDEAGKINILGKSPEIILVFAISSSIVVSVSFSMGVDRSIIWLLSAVAVFMILYGIILINRTSVIITAAILLFAGFVTLLNRGLRGAVLKLYSELPEFTKWVLEFSGGITAYDEKYANTLLIIIISFTVFFTMLFTLKFFNFFVVLSAGMTFFIITYINEYLVRYSCFYVFIASMLVYYILRVYRSFSVHKPNEYASRTKVFLWSLPSALLIMTVSLLLPFSSGPIKWDWMDRKFERFMGFWDSIYQSPASFEYFSAASSGFGDGSGILGGKTRSDDTRVLLVEAKYPVYLKGIAASKYGDNRWQDMKSFRKDITGIDSILQDTTELREGLQILAGTGICLLVLLNAMLYPSFENLRQNLFHSCQARIHRPGQVRN